VDNDAVILVIEDEPQEATLLLEAFRGRGFQHHIRVVGDGVEAMDYLLGRGKFERRPQSPPTLILLDLALPRMDGFEVLNELRQDKWLKYVPVVVFTGAADDQKRLAALDRGAKFVIAKPKNMADYDALAERITNLLRFLE